YVPLIPWASVVLFGMLFGSVAYPGGRCRIHVQMPRLLSPICFAGRNSLLIYMLHQPVIAGLLYLAI
ncbi:MAG: DUF1624 domain-containing protein, partial [Candidatus Aenigmatarchaeota archaeon]